MKNTLGITDNMLRELQQTEEAVYSGTQVDGVWVTYNLPVRMAQVFRLARLGLMATEIYPALADAANNPALEIWSKSQIQEFLSVKTWDDL